MNPLLTTTVLPLFSEIKPEHIEPAISQLLAEARAVVDQQLQATTHYTWNNLVEPLEEAEDRLSAYERGEMKSVPAKDVFRRLESKRK